MNVLAVEMGGVSPDTTADQHKQPWKRWRVQSACN